MKERYHLSMFLLMLIIIQTLPALSQNLSIGVEGGSGMKFIYHKHIFEEGIKPGIGFSGGAYARYDFLEKLTLKAGLSFERKGAYYHNFTEERGHYSENLNYNYLTLPILLQTHFGKKVQFFLNVGPYLGFMVSANQVMVWREKDEREIGDMLKYQKRFDLGISSGFGLEIPITTMLFLSCEIRNNLGLLNLFKVETIHSKTMNNTTNLLFGFGYRFQKK